LRRNEYRIVFILGHVRSGSSLLAHILANHPDIVGAGETHICYQTQADLPKLVLRTCELLHRPFLGETYVVDQINHPYVSNDVLLARQLYKSIILIREPEATIRSIMTLFKCQEREALEIYIRRLEELTRYGPLLGDRALLVQYGDLIDRTDETLTALTRFLGLDSPLTPNYATHRMTGRMEGNGDPSDNIKAGQIIRTAGNKVVISDDTLVAATRAFRSCRAGLHAGAVQAVSAAAFLGKRAALAKSSK
jgi:hypothetical protein